MLIAQINAAKKTSVKTLPKTNTPINKSSVPAPTLPSQKQPHSHADTIVKANPSPQLTEPSNKNLIPKPLNPLPEVIKDRANPLIKTIATNSPDIQIQLFDNGEIDGDTITVYHNNEVIAYKKRLSDKPITIHIQADAENTLHEFVMVANNLGTIPPNTALMVITTGGKRYELFYFF